MMPTRCPVCGRVGLPYTAVECPQCNADLEAFQLLEVLQEAPPVPPAPTKVITTAAPGMKETSPVVRPPAPRPIPLTLWAGLVGVFLGSGIMYLMPRTGGVAPNASRAVIEPVLQQLQQQLAETQKGMARRDEATEQRLAEGLDRIAEQLPGLARRHDLEVLDERLSLLERRLQQQTEQASVRPTPTVRRHLRAIRPTAETETTSGSATMRLHHLTRSDTLWNIAERYYGTGHFYPVLLALNPGLGTRFAPTGKIRLPADLATARQLLAESIVEQEGRRLLRYPIVAGDTWPKISQRLYGHPHLAAELDRLNGGSPPEPGKSALAPLTD